MCFEDSKNISRRFGVSNLLAENHWVKGLLTNRHFADRHYVDITVCRDLETHGHSCEEQTLINSLPNKCLPAKYLQAKCPSDKCP
jgi:hypothetical protein